MKRSEINLLVAQATACFERNGWTLPPSPLWDVTDFGSGAWREYGLVLVNLAEEAEYCEKLMFGIQGMKTPAHTHLKKKEDIICRWGEFEIRLFERPDMVACPDRYFKLNGKRSEAEFPVSLKIEAGSRITLPPGVFHEFWPISQECIMGEVSTANDDLTDNVFLETSVGRFSSIDEDEKATVKLVSD